MECAVCYTSYDAEINKPHTPIVMDCGHTVCKTCFHRLIKGKYNMCPFACEQAIGKTLRVNYSLMNLADVSHSTVHDASVEPATTGTIEPPADINSQEVKYCKLERTRRGCRFGAHCRFEHMHEPSAASFSRW